MMEPIAPSAIMNIRFAALVALAFANVSLANALATDAVAPPTITTTGSVELRVPADVADLQFAVKIRHPDLLAARKEQAERATRILKVLRDAGVEEKDLKTSQVNVSTDYEGSQGQDTSTVSFYEVEQGFTCTLHGVEKISDVTSAVLAAGATQVGRADMRTSTLRQHLDDARAQATKAAREKAVAIAKELDVKVGKPYKIVENVNGESLDGYVYYKLTDQPVAGISGPQGVFAAGLISVSARVDVTFYLE